MDLSLRDAHREAVDSHVGACDQRDRVRTSPFGPFGKPRSLALRIYFFAVNFMRMASDTAVVLASIATV
jgi:hypothetical protein